MILTRHPFTLCAVVLALLASGCASVPSAPGGAAAETAPVAVAKTAPQTPASTTAATVSMTVAPNRPPVAVADAVEQDGLAGVELLGLADAEDECLHVQALVDLRLRGAPPPSPDELPDCLVDDGFCSNAPD